MKNYSGKKLAKKIDGKNHDIEIDVVSTGRKVYLYKIEGGFIEQQENGDLNFTDLTLERLKEFYETGI